MTEFEKNQAGSDRIIDIVKTIRSSQGWQEDDASVWLGPWLHEIEDIALGERDGYSSR